MTNKNEIACVYASLILVDDDIAVTVRSYFSLLLSFHLYFCYFSLILESSDMDNM